MFDILYSKERKERFDEARDQFVRQMVSDLILDLMKALNDNEKYFRTYTSKDVKAMILRELL